MQQSFFAHGKVMLCGEYSVLSGTESLALPVHPGQWLNVWEVPATTATSRIIWQASDENGPWFDCRIDTEIMHVAETNHPEMAEVLLKLFREIKQRNPELLAHKTIRMETLCQFNRDFGLGSSSSLVAILSNWSGTDAFALQRAAFGGSGYDAAVSKTGKPICYWLENEAPNWSAWALDPALTGHWYLAFPGQKQNSRTSVSYKTDALKALKSNVMALQQLNTCVQAVKFPRSIPMLEAMLELLQALLAEHLQLPRAYEDLQIQPVQGGLCKWLGAWGGDVLLVNEKILQDYPVVFETMTVIPWNELVIAS